MKRLMKKLINRLIGLIASLALVVVIWAVGEFQGMSGLIALVVVWFLYRKFGYKFRIFDED